MTPEAIETASEILADARRRNATVTTLPEGCVPQTVDEGYAVQQAFIERWPSDRAGWKVGATAPDVQALYGEAEPHFGPFFEDAIFQTPAVLPAAEFQELCVEAEFAFRFAANLWPRAEPYGRDEVLALAKVLLPSVELISARLGGELRHNRPAAIADSTHCGGFVYGIEIPDWRGMNLVDHRVRLLVDGEVRAEGTGARVLGDPVNVLVWLVNDLSRRGLPLAAGDVVSTGTCTGLTFLEAGQTAVADFGALGEVRVRFE